MVPPPAHNGADPDLLEVVRGVAAEVAPEELPLVAALALLPPGEADRRLARRTSRDDPLGFGMGEVAALAVPVIWTAVQEVVNHMATSAADGLAARVRARVRRWLRREKPPAPLPRFGPTELDAVRARVRELAVRDGMGSDRAELLAYRVADRLSHIGSDERSR